MSAPQIVWIVLVTMSLTLNLAMHGKPRTGKHSFPQALFAVSLTAGLLWWGGFFG